jgi:sulfur carrier protein ThiS
MSTKPAAAETEGIVLLRLGVGKQGFALPEGATLADLLREAGVHTDDQVIMIDGRRLEEILVLHPGMIVTVMPRPEETSRQESWRDTIGMFRDDPVFDEMMRMVQAERDAEKETS